jgi:hypothetical protein
MNVQAVSSKVRTVITLLTVGSLVTGASAASAATLKVSIENLAPQNGTLLTPLWVGFHDGGFDIYDRDASLDLFPGTESLVEDGATQQISDRFAAVGAGEVQGTILGAEGANAGPIDIGETATLFFEVDPTLASSRFFSYATMVIPSNDAFIANGNPTAHPIFDEVGNFIGADFIEFGADVLDGGTEVNDESPVTTAFFGQAAPNTSVDENGVVTTHPGFNSVGSGGILDSAQFANADFKAEGYQVARIRVQLVEDTPQAVPEPTTALGLFAVVSTFWLSRRQQAKVTSA